MNSRLGERGSNLVHRDSGVFHLDGVRTFVDVGEHLPRAASDVVVDGDSRLDSTLQPRHSHHEEFVQVVRENREEIHPFQNRNGGVFRQLEHPLVERQPGQFAVEESVVGKRGVANKFVAVPVIFQLGVGGTRYVVQVSHSSSPDGANRYPTLRTVPMTDSRSPSLARSRRTCTSTVRVPPK